MRTSLVFGTFLTAYGLAVIQVSFFLLTWRLVTGGAPDIAARGPFLLGLLLPEFAVVVLVLTVIFALFARPRREWPTRGTVSAFAALCAMALCYFGPDPLAPLISWVAPARPTDAAVRLIIGMLLAISGLLLLNPSVPLKRAMLGWSAFCAIFFCIFVVKFSGWVSAEVAMEYERGYRTTTDGDSLGIPIGTAAFTILVTQLIATALLYLMARAVRRRAPAQQGT